MRPKTTPPAVRGPGAGREVAKEGLVARRAGGLHGVTKSGASTWAGRGVLLAAAADGKLMTAVGEPVLKPATGAPGILDHAGFLTLLGLCVAALGLLIHTRRRLAEHARTLERRVAERTAALENDLRRRESLEKSLVESEERFSRVFNSGPVLATISALATGRLLAVNQMFCDTLGYSREELLGNRTAELGIWVNPGTRDELIRRATEGERVTNREVLTRTRGGAILTVLLSVERVSLGAEDCLLVFGMDISERRAVERRLTASEEMFSQAFRHNPLLAAITSLVDQRVLDCNDRLCEFTGLSREQMLNSLPTETGRWVDTRTRSRLVQRVIHEQVIHNEEVEMRNGHGEIRRLLVSLQRLTLHGEPAALWLSSDITERSRMAEEVRRSERRFRELFEDSGEGALVADAGGRYLDANPAALALFGCTLEQLRAMVIGELVAPEERERLPKHFAQVAGGAVVRGEWRLQRRDGSPFFAEVSVRRTADGGSFALVRDVTERRAAMERLRESEMLLNETGAIAKVGGWRLELGTGATEWTDEAARIHGVQAGTPAEADRMIAQYTPESAERIRAAVRQASHDGNPYELEVAMALPGGAVRWVRVLGRAERHHDQITHLRGTVQDITEFRQALERLRESEERFSKIFLRTPIIVAISTFPEGRYVEVNQCFTQVLGYSAAEVVGRRALDLGIWAYPEQRAEAIRRVVAGERVTDYEYALRTASGEVVEVIGAVEPIGLGDQQCLMFIAQDVTARKQAERRLRQSESTLQSVFRGMHDALIVADIATRRLVQANDAAGRLLGYAPDELLQLRVDDLHPPEHLAAVLAGFAEQSATESARAESLPVRRKDGSVMLADLSTARTVLEGRPCLVGVFHDVTEQRKAEGLLRQSEANLAAIFEGIADCIMVADAETRELLRLNSTAAATFGYGEGDWPHLKIEDLHPPEDRELVIAGFRQQALHTATPAGEFRFRRRDGSYFVGEITTTRLQLWERNCLVGVMRDVTERRQTEAALRERLELQERVAGLAAAMPGVMYSFQITAAGQWRFLDMGPRVSEVLGVPAAAVLADSRNAFALVHPADLAELQHSIEQAHQGRLAWNHVFRINHPVKGTVWIEGHAGPAGQSSDGVVWHGVLLDVTQRQTLATQRLTRDAVARILADSESLEWTVPKVLQAVCGGEGFDYGELWLLDPADSRLTCEFAWPDADLRFAPLVAETASRRFAADEGLKGQVLRRGRAVVVDDLARDPEFRRKQGALESGLHSAIALPIKAGLEVIGVLLLLRGERVAPDAALLEMLGSVSSQLGQYVARKRAQADLRRFVTLSSSVIYALRITPEGFRPYWVSDNLEAMTGFAPDEGIRGTWWREHLHPGDRERVLQQSAELTQAGHQVLEFRFRRKDGSYIWLRDEKRVTHNAVGKPAEIIGSWTDISDRRHLEAQLLQSQKMEAIGHLSGGIAHDFNNILGAIIGNAQLAQMDLAAGHPVAECLAQIVKGSQRATRLVRQILTFARQNPQEMERVNLGPVIEESVRLLKATIPATVTVTLNLAEHLPEVVADETQIQQIILNLGTNAWHAMEDRIGRLDLAVATVEAGPELLARLPELRPGRHLRLRVSDNGHGMAAEVLSRIFDPFFTTKEPGKGTGLGLSVVHGIVRSHGGLITVESTVGTGTVFDVYLPAAEPVSTPPPAAPANPVTEAVTAAGRHILVVDDEIPLLRVTTRALERLGHRVTACADARAALDAFPRLAADLQLVLTDLNMPGPSGLDLARELRRLRPGLPVLLASGFITDSLRNDAREAGVAGILRKPLGLEELGHAIRTHLLS